ncbi:MAG: tRNA uridine-5-carboxymethylaminomethyl(34) synthesis enzyme MnmG [Alphaproteobacteria bacterium]|nr:tRNA uridine-5-carboxymethylaminomethyl(34) synthesis enzyme MnmG [Alphaproteobacteria bacterium]
MFNRYDVIVAGAGHAGCEAAAAAANMGSKVLLITMNMQTIAQMSCNPAMGGIAKGQIIREIDALGGQSGIVSDLSTLQFRMLNKSKGPAMWSPRTQNDRHLFAQIWRQTLEQNLNIDLYQDMVQEILVENNKAIGVVTAMGNKIFSQTVVLTSGTFLNGVIHIGEKQFGGGRVAEKSAKGITEQLVSLGFEARRLKTGTPPRIDGRSLNYAEFEEQKGDNYISGFSFLKSVPKIQPQHQKSCFITYTNHNVHEILKTGFDRSPMFQGRIEGIGPRYCPSIEDKINRFADKNRHQLFVEPEGFNTIEIYLNGFSTSLPEDVQFKALKELPGFKNVKMFRPGYAIEYDYFPPTQLKNNLESKLLDNLFCAGQINGTTGYEEAACQGLIAGINAHLKTQELMPFVLNRNDAYIGVLIDDLINKGTDEPYRMFTSRAEFRTLLRQDNADLRLTEKGYQIGLADSERLTALKTKQHQIEHLKTILNSTVITPEDINLFLSQTEQKVLSEKQKADKLLLRPEVNLDILKKYVPKITTILNDFEDDVLEQAELDIKYKRYIEKELELAEKMLHFDNMLIPENFDYLKLKSLSAEAQQKFVKIKPKSIGQASRISGVNPSDIQILMVYMGR